MKPKIKADPLRLSLTMCASALGALILLFALAPPASAGDAARGKYLAIIGDCEICHTAPDPNAKPYAGGFPLHAYFGTVYSTNITPDRQTGIGNWSSADFYRAVHDGVAADGHHLYPAFPYPYFSGISRVDSDALYAYLRTLAPVHAPPAQNRLIFPTNIRFLMMFWNWLFYPQSEFHPDPAKSADWNRGGDIAHGLGHCGGCHTPKNFFFSDEGGKVFQGDTVDGWYAPPLTGNRRTGLGDWSLADLEQYLQTGSNRFGRVIGSMRAVISDSTSRWSDADRHAVAVYLKSLPPASEKRPQKPSTAQMAAGESVYVADCSACHSADQKDYPSLAKNRIVMADDPTSIIRVILYGSQSPTVPGRSPGFSMPAFPVLSDQELADAVTYIRNSWGNSADPVSKDRAADIRRTLEKIN
jgi:mono/diheme cytochrome c family protein